MTDVQTTLPEAALLEALRVAIVPTTERDDPGLTISEIAVAEYGNAYACSRDKVSRRLQPLIAAGTIRRGWRHGERIDGQRYRTAVFAVAA